MNIKTAGGFMKWKKGLLIFFAALFFIITLQVVIGPNVSKDGRVAADSTAENRAQSYAQNYCDNVALDSSGGDSKYLDPCKQRYVAFFLGDEDPDIKCPDPGSDSYNQSQYQWCFDAAKAGYNQRVKSFTDLPDICNVFVSNAQGGNWPNFSQLNGQAKQKAVNACNKGLGQGLVHSPGHYPTNEDCSTEYKGDSNLIAACEAGESLADAHLFTTSEVKAVAKSGNLAKTNGGSTGGPGSTGPGGGSANSDELGCDASSNPLSWVICPVINDLLVPAIEQTDTIITQQLTIQSQNIFCSGGNKTCGDYYSAWASFRDLSLGLLAAAGMIVIVAQALGMEVLDAYTIRKVLPRLLIAAIAITLSWPLMNFAVTLSNNLGYGVRELIVAPFHNLGNQIDLSFSSSSVVNLITGFTGLIVAGVAMFVAGLGILLSYLATAGLAVLIAVMVLVLRQIVIIMLIILSPVALVSYILPNTQRVFKLWWESFSKALLMFPLIAGFIAAGRVFAAISLSTTGGQTPNLFNELIGFVAYFAPYFMIPMTFRMSGGIMSGLGNMIAQRGQALQGRISGYRGEQWKGRNERFRQGTLAEGKKWIPGSIKAANVLNRTGSGLGVGWKGRYGFGRRGKEALGQHHLTAAGELARDPHMQAIAGYNDANRILAEAAGDERRGREGLYQHLMAGGDDGKFGEGMSPEGKRAAALAKVDKAAKAAKAAGGFTEAHGVAAMHSMARDGTAIRDTDDLARLAALNGHGDRNLTFTNAATVASESRQAGRSDLAAASEPIGELAFAHSDRIYKHGLIAPTDEPADMQLGRLRFKAWQSGNGGEVSYTKFSTAKGRTVRNDTRTAVDVLRAHMHAVRQGRESPYSDDEVQFAAASLVDAQNAIKNNYGKLNNRDDAGKELAKDEGALDWYLDRPTEVQERVVGPGVEGTVPRGTTNRELVSKIVGDRYAGLTPEQRKIAEQQAAEQNEETEQ